MMLFNDFVQKYKLKKATSNIKIQKVLTSIGLDNVNTYLREGPFSGGIGIVNLHPSKGTHCVCYINENYFESFGCVPPKKLSKCNIKRNGYCFYSENQIQKKYQVSFLCKLLFTRNLFDKSVRYRFYICCFKFILSKNLLNINDIKKSIY